MNNSSLSHVTDSVLVRDLAALVARDRANKTSLLGHLAEVDARQAEGRLQPSEVIQIVPHLTEETVDELLAGAPYWTKSEIEQLLARLFPRPEVPARVEPISPSPSSEQLAPGPGGAAQS